MFWNINTISTLITTIAYGVILVVVLRSKPRTRLREIFGYYLLTMVTWSISAFLATSGIANVLFWFKVWAASPIAMMVAIFYFVQILFGHRRSWASLVLLYGCVAVALTLFTDGVVLSARLDQSGQFLFELGMYLGIVAAPGFLLIIFSMFELYRGYGKTNDSDQRNRIRYLLVGLTFTIISSLLNLTPLHRYPIDLVSNGITAVLIACAILRHQLLDIRLVLRWGLLYSFTTGFFASFYYLIIFFVMNIFQLIIGREMFAISIIVGILTALILSPIRTQFQVWVDRLFYREKFNATMMLQRLTQTVTSSLNLEELTDELLSDVVSTLHIVNASILINDSDSGNFQMIATKRDHNKFITNFTADHPIVAWMTRNKKPLLIDDLAVIPTFKSMWERERDTLKLLQAELFIPIITRAEMIGLFIFGPRLSTEPYNKEDIGLLTTVANQVAVAIKNARLYDELEDTFIQTVIALANAIDVRDTYTNMHSQWIAKWSVETALHLGCTNNEASEIRWGSLLHDIGKIGISDNILNKPGELDNHEWEIVRKHTILGAEMISPIKKLSKVAPLIRHSHERYDGSGYPDGLVGEQIPLGARIISVVDSFSAMRDVRTYKKSFSVEDAAEELRRHAGKMYDPKVVDAFLKVFETNRVF